MRHPTQATLLVIASSSLIGLIFLGLAWELWLAPLHPGGSWLVLKIVPLLLALRGILHGRRYTYRWSTLMIWLYFTEGSVRAWSDSPPGNGLGLIETALALVFFIATAWYARNAGRP